MRIALVILDNGGEWTLVALFNVLEKNHVSELQKQFVSRNLILDYL